MDAFIISIGSELLTGHTVNTNAAWLASQLNMAGVGVSEVRAIPDNEGDILRALNDAAEKTTFVLLTGGLGPTNDDITTRALCKYFGSDLITDSKVLEDIRLFFKTRGRDPGSVNLRQAMVPEKAARVIRNPYGTAPGLWFEKGGVSFIAMPGVPHEMQNMFSFKILPEIRKKSPGRHILHRHVLTHGIGESFLAERISGWEKSLPPAISLAYLPSAGIVKLRLSASGEDEEELRNLIGEQIAGLRKIIGEFIWGYDNDTLGQVVGKLLRERGLKLGCAESCTGGYLSHKITLIPGSSDYFNGSIIAYSNRVKEEILGVPAELISGKGAVSSEVAGSMARGARKFLGCDFSVAITGIAGPSGGSGEKPTGTTWISISSEKGTISRKYTFGDTRERNIMRAANAALAMLAGAISDKFYNQE